MATAKKATPKQAPKQVTIPGKNGPAHRAKDLTADLQDVVDDYFAGTYSGIALVAVKTDGSTHELVHVDTKRGKMTDVLMLQSVVSLAGNVGKLYPRK